MFCRCLGLIWAQRWRQPGSGPGQLSDAREKGRGLAREVRFNRQVQPNFSCQPASLLSDAREKGRGLAREVRLDLAVVSGLCRSLGLREEKRETRRQFPETENVRRFDRLYCRYS